MRDLPEKSPLKLFRAWYDEAARAASEHDWFLVDAVTLATATKAGKPSARLVLLKSFDDRGFVFFTSYQSRKARELDANPRAALAVHWPMLERQVRVEGRVRRVSRAESEAYFATRARGSQLGAWASRQSAPIAGRAALDAQLARVTERFEAGDVPCPPFWGGYRLMPESIEFWQGRPDRLHDRRLYRRKGGHWALSNLSP